MKKAIPSLCLIFFCCSNSVHPPLTPVGAWQAVDGDVVHSLILFADSAYSYDKVITIEGNEREVGVWSFNGGIVTLKPIGKASYDLFFSRNLMTYKNFSFTRITLNFHGVEYP